MPLHDIVVLTLIVTVFAAFGVALASLTWYCRDAGKRTSGRAVRAKGGYPVGGGLITDDD